MKERTLSVPSEKENVTFRFDFANFSRLIFVSCLPWRKYSRVDWRSGFADTGTFAASRFSSGTFERRRSILAEIEPDAIEAAPLRPEQPAVFEDLRDDPLRTVGERNPIADMELRDWPCCGTHLVTPLTKAAFR